MLRHGCIAATFYPEHCLCCVIQHCSLRLPYWGLLYSISAPQVPRFASLDRAHFQTFITERDYCCLFLRAGEEHSLGDSAALCYVGPAGFVCQGENFCPSFTLYHGADMCSPFLCANIQKMERLDRKARGNPVRSRRLDRDGHDGNSDRRKYTFDERQRYEKCMSCDMTFRSISKC